MKSLPRVAVVALIAAVALLWLLCFDRRSGIRAYSTDRRVVIYDARYSGGTNLQYSYVEPASRFRYKIEGLLRGLGIHSLPWKRVTPVVLSSTGLGPALVLYGRIEVSYDRLELAPQRGMALRLVHPPFSPSVGRANSYLYLWDYALTNGTFHLRAMGETNDLALFEVRQ